MPTYNFKFRVISEPQAIDNGSGNIAFDVQGVYRLDGSGDPFVTMPSGYHKSAMIDSDQLQLVNDMPHGNAPEKQAKNAALKDLLREALRSPIGGRPGFVVWDTPEMMQEYMDKNDHAILEAQRLTDYVITTLGLTFPIDLTL